MYKCRLTYDEWKCILSKERAGRTVDTPLIRGYIGLLTIGQVSKEQVWHYGGREVTVCAGGYHWLTILPADEFYCITVMMDQAYRVKVCYIDIIDSQGYDADGVPYFYDLYLDLVVYPDGNIIADDLDELQAALQKGEITRTQYDKAIMTAHTLQNGLLANAEKFKGYVSELLCMLKGR